MSSAYYQITLTLSPPSTTIVPYPNSLDLDETQSNSVSHLDPSCLTHKTTFSQTLSNIEALLTCFSIQCSPRLVAASHIRAFCNTVIVHLAVYMSLCRSVRVSLNKCCLYSMTMTVSNSLDPGGMAIISAYHLDLSCQHMALWSRLAG